MMSDYLRMHVYTLCTPTCIQINAKKQLHHFYECTVCTSTNFLYRKPSYKYQYINVYIYTFCSEMMITAVVAYLLTSTLLSARGSHGDCESSCNNRK